MKKIFYTISLILVTLLIFSCETIKPPEDKIGSRFQYIRSEYTSEGELYSLYLDTDTGVMYWNLGGLNNEYFSGLTVLLDTDGKPLLYNHKKSLIEENMDEEMLFTQQYAVTFIYSDAESASYICDTEQDAKDMLYNNFELFIDNYNELNNNCTVVKYINDERTFAQIEYIEKENGYTESTQIFVTKVYE